MSERTKSRLMIAAGVLLLVLIGALWPVLGWNPFSRFSRADQCIRCGAVHTRSGREVKILGARWKYDQKAEIVKTPLTEAWNRYVGGCAHNWAFKYYNEFHGGKKLFADGFPSFRHPATRNPAGIAKAIARLPDEATRRSALSAVTDPNNWLRFVAGRALRDILEVPETSTAKWWSAHSNYFDVETNMVAATAILKNWETVPDHPFEFEIDECLEAIRRVETGVGP